MAINSNQLSLLLLLAYFLAVLALGFKAHKGETSDGFLISDRNRSGLSTGLSITIGWAGGLFYGYYASSVHSHGWAPLFCWIAAIALGFFILGFITPRIKRLADEHAFYMLPDYFNKLYSPRIGFAILLCQFSLFFAWLIAQFIVGAQIVSGFSGLTYQTSIALMALFTLPYLLLGGFKAVLNTDVFQFIAFVVITCFLLLSGLSTKNISLPPLSTSTSLGFDTSFSIVFMGALWVVVSGDVWQRIYATKNTTEAKKSLVWGTLSYSIIALLVCAPFLLSYNASTEVLNEDFLVFSLQSVFTENFAPIIALMLMISIMSTIDTATFSSAMSITNDFALKLNLIKKEELTYWTKLVIVVLMVSAALAANYVPNLVNLLYGMMSLATCIAPAILATFFKRWKVSEPALFYSIITGIVVYSIKFSLGFAGPWIDMIPLGSAIAALILVNRINPKKS